MSQNQGPQGKYVSRPSEQATSATAIPASAPPIVGDRVLIDPAKLAPNLNEHRVAIETAHWYWIGLMPTCPVEAVTLGGECFPKLEERVSKDHQGETVRVPVIGAVVRLNRSKFDRIAERLSRTIVRFTANDNGEQEEPGTGKNIGEPHRRARKGFLIQIPTREEVEARRSQGMSAPVYDQRQGDEPLANHMFAVLCPNQSMPMHGQFLPEPISKTGLEWPASFGAGVTA